jgi:hypothetical protein
VFRGRHIVKTALSLAPISAGFATIAFLPSWQASVAGALIANLGCGMILPTLMTWAVSDLPSGVRGKGVAFGCAPRFWNNF